MAKPQNQQPNRIQPKPETPSQEPAVIDPPVIDEAALANDGLQGIDQDNVRDDENLPTDNDPEDSVPAVIDDRPQYQKVADAESDVSHADKEKEALTLLPKLAKHVGQKGQKLVTGNHISFIEDLHERVKKGTKLTHGNIERIKTLAKQANLR